MKKQLFVLLIFSLFFLKVSIHFSFFQNSKDTTLSTKKIISSLTESERFYLEYFFRVLFLHGNGYVLYGEKPSSFVSYSFPFQPLTMNAETYYQKFLAENFKIFNSLRFFESYLMKKGWKTWEKIKEKLTIRKYLILKYHSNQDNVEGIITVNKKTFIHTVNENRQYFSQLFGCQITGRRLIKILKENPLFFLEKIKSNNHECIGILLGLGKYNSYLFQQRENIRRKLTKTIYKKNSVHYQKFLTEYNKYNTRLKPAFNGKFFRLSMCNLPGFVADSTTVETKELETKYRKDQLKIIQELKNHNFLEKVLERLIN